MVEEEGGEGEDCPSRLAILSGLLTFDCSIGKVMTFPLEGVTLSHMVARGWALVLDDVGFSSALPLKHSMTLR